MLDPKLIDNIIKALQFEYKAYSRFLEISQNKTDCLVSNDMDALLKITEQEKEMADQTLKLSQVREQLIDKVCRELGKDSKSFTIEELMNYAGDSQQKALKDLQGKLKDVISKLTCRNGINQKLIDSALKYIDFNMQLMASPQPDVPLYGKSGQEVVHNAKRSMLDVKY